MKNKHRLALAAIDRSLALGTATAEEILHKSRLHVAIGDSVGALHAADHGVHLFPENTYINDHASYLYAVAGEWSKALSASEIALSASPANEQLQLRKIMALQMLDRIPDAIAFNRRLLESSSNPLPLLQQLSYLCLMVSDWAGAAEASQRGLELSPGDPTFAARREMATNVLKDQARD